MSTWIVRNPPGPGVRIAVKDLIDIAGLPTTAACQPVAESAPPAAVDAVCLAGIRAAEARGEVHIAGKTNLHELAFGITGINHWAGTPVNPLDPSRIPGGSSSGSAVAVAAGEADLALGSDTGGSIRIPAACCGIAGLKTTWGRIPLDGVRPLAQSLDTVGPMAADVAGLAAGMALLEPGFQPAAEAPQRIGRLETGGDPATEAAVDAALAASSFEVVPLDLGDLTAVHDAAMTILNAEAWEANQPLVRATPDALGRDVLQRLSAAQAITAADVAAAWEVAGRWRETVNELWSRFDLVALPTLLGPPPPLERAGDIWPIRGLTSPVNLAGIPALALPVPRPGGLPASLQLLGPSGGEAQLLAAGAIIEAAIAE